MEVDINTIYNQLNYLDETKQEIKQALINKGQEVTSEQTFRSYVNNINNLGNIKLFNTVQEMQDDPTAKPDDMAVVYNINENEIIDLDTTYSNLWLPKVVANPYSIFEALLSINLSTTGLVVFTCNEDDNYTIKFDIDTDRTNLKVKIVVHFLDHKYEYNCSSEKNYFELSDLGGVYLSETATRTFTPMQVEDPSSKVGKAIALVQKLFRYGNVDFSGLYTYSGMLNSWVGTTTQYSAIDDDVMAVDYFGANGGSVGTLNTIKYFSSYTELNDFQNYINKYANFYQTLDVTNVNSNLFFRSYYNETLSNMSEINCVNIQNLSGNDMCNLFSGFKFYALKNTGNWNFENINNTADMFSGCTNLTYIDGISKWNVANVTNMAGMFRDCYRLGINNGEVFLHWNTANVTNMSNMFVRCTLLGNNISSGTTIYLIYNMSNFSFENVTTTAYMFSGCSSLMGFNAFNLPHLAPNLVNTSGMFMGCKNLVKFDSRDTYSNSLGLDMVNVIDVSNMFAECSNLKALQIGTFNEVQNTENMFKNCTSLINISFNMKSINHTSAVNMFAGCRSLTYLSNLNISGIKYMTNMFADCTSLSSISNFQEGYKTISGNTANAVSFENMFAGCKSMVGVPSYITFNTTNVRIVNGIFRNSGIVRTVGTFWNFPNVSGRVSGIFNRCFHLAEYNLSRANMPNITEFTADCWSLNTHKASLNMENARFDNMSNLNLGFDGGVSGIRAYNLYAPKLNINTGFSILDINFANATIDSIKLNNFIYGGHGVNLNLLGLNVIGNKPTNTSVMIGAGTSQYSTVFYLDLDFELTSEVTNMSRMFIAAQMFTMLPENLPYFPYFVNFNTSKCTDMSYMFYNTNMSAELPTYDTSNVTNLAYMCYNQRNPDGMHNAPPFDLSNAINLCGMFRNCIYLENVPEYNLYNANDISLMFASSAVGRSNASIQNIINSFLSIRPDSPVVKNLSVQNTSSPFYGTSITSDKYSDRLQELDDAGWTY